MAHYLDEVRVKISERYKPPHRINLPVTYSQRISQNNQVLDNLPKYDFGRERQVLEQIRDLKAQRSAKLQERHARLQASRAEWDKKVLEEQEEQKEDEASGFITPTNNGNILVPTQATSILIPIPLKSQVYTGKPVDKSPFNISDFEDDTSSPFDNMELKSINDMEELAMVLKSDETPTTTSRYSTTNTLNYTSQPSGNYYNYSYNMPSRSLPYSQTNGYYYGTPNYSNYNYSKVPEKDKAEKEVKIKEKAVKIEEKEDELENPFGFLSKDLQEFCSAISSMGFPVARVARTCKALGSDQKKVVEHLLTLSELLDLGFKEQDISQALLETNNDKDKALDKLIS